MNRVDPDGLQPLIWKIYNAIGRENLNAVRDFSAGLASGLSAGFSNYALDALGDVGRRDRCSGFHSAGEWAGAIADLALGGKSLLKNLSEIGFGPLKQWVRVGKSYSQHLDEPISLSIRWGASPAKGGKYLEQIANPTLRSFNQWLRSKRIHLEAGGQKMLVISIFINNFTILWEKYLSDRQTNILNILIHWKSLIGKFNWKG